jgi:hypothetical protein
MTTKTVKHSRTPLQFLQETKFRLETGIGYDPVDLKKWLPTIAPACNAHMQLKVAARLAIAFIEAHNMQTLDGNKCLAYEACKAALKLAEEKP